MKIAFTFLALFLGVTTCMADEQYDLWKKAYPKAQEGQVRHVLHLPQQANEQAMKVELIVGKVMETDGVNLVSLGGTIKEQDVPGWGYPQQIVTIAEGGAISTLIGVPPGQKPVKKFVTLTGGPHLIRYNSKLPVVVYAPEGYDVKYRFWKADAETKTIEADKE
jgi:ecotin